MRLEKNSFFVGIELVSVCRGNMNKINYQPIKKDIIIDHFKSLSNVKITVPQLNNDIDVLGFIFKLFKPQRHLEFGTWTGESALACLQNSDATVWTLNKLFGEYRENGEYAYGNNPGDKETISWAKKVKIYDDGNGYYKTDAIGFTGRKYLGKNLGHRVCQIYCDSEDWDTTNYPDNFFDSIFIDGGHEKNIVISDTLKSLPVLRSKGILIWHDFLPEKGIYDTSDGVICALEILSEQLNKQFSKLLWVEDTMLLIGIKK